MAKLFKRSINWKKVCLSAVAIVLVLASVGGVAALFGKQTKTISATSWVVGNLDSQGKFVEDTQTLVSKDLIPCEGISIEKTFKGECDYEIYYYDVNDHFMAKVTPRDDLYSEDYPGAVSCRIVISPECPVDEKISEFKISFWEVTKFAKNIKVTVDKEQPKYSTVRQLWNSVKDVDTIESGVMTLKGGISVLDTESTNGELYTSTPLITLSDEYDAYRIYIKLDSDSGRDAYVAFADACLAGEQKGTDENNDKIICATKSSKYVNEFTHIFEYSNSEVGIWRSVIVEAPAIADVLRVSYDAGDTEVRIYGLAK